MIGVIIVNKYIKCSYCGKLIYKGEPCLEHEYASKYCSYKCLVLGGFYGHYKLYELDDEKIQEAM